MTGSVRCGIYVNNRAAAFLGSEYSLARLLEAAVLAEDCGFDFVAVGDTVAAKPRYSPLPLLSAIGARTNRIGLATGILQPHFRHPLLLAQEWATLDALSGGRTILGVGLGSGPAEVRQREDAAFGLGPRGRPRAFEEAIVLLRALWTQDEVSFEGAVFRLHRISLGIRPLQQPHPPILVACGSYLPARPADGATPFYTRRRRDAPGFRGPFERVARLGDGWITNMATPEELRQALQQIRALAARDCARTLAIPFPVVLNCFIHVAAPGSEQSARREAAAMFARYHAAPVDWEIFDRWVICGTPAECAERLTRYIQAGVTGFQFVIAAADQLGQIRRIAEEIRPLLPRMLTADHGVASGPIATEGRWPARGE